MTETLRPAEVPQPAWRPTLVTAPAWYQWPPRPLRLLRWFAGFPSYLFPWNAVYLAASALAWFVLTPDLAEMRELSFGWVSLILLRNVGLVLLFGTVLHYWFFTRKAQGTRYKYDDKWLFENNAGFLFRSQLWDNVFWSLTGVIVFSTGFEVLTLWMFANGVIPTLGFQEHPIAFVLLLLAVPVLRDVHFYIVHLLLHWGPLYRAAHYLHHKNTRIGPWSGLSMHPLEHLVYFTGVCFHWVILSHPLHAVFHLQHAVLAAVVGHTPFERIEVRGKPARTGVGGYYHYLHHRDFECNYGSLNTVPADLWLNCFHDGSSEKAALIQERRRRMHKR